MPTPTQQSGQNVRPPAIAGAFYPALPDEISEMVTRDLTDAQARMDMKTIASKPTPKVLIAPHAGLIYSGPIAASAYAHVLHGRDKIKRVILLGPCHRVAVQGMALSGADQFRTPLGDVPLDREVCSKLETLPFVETFDQTHAQEHSLEIHLPFLQTILPSFTLVPIVVGPARAVDVAQALDMVWGGPETLIVISTDLSHFLDYEACVNRDSQTRTAIETLSPQDIANDQACGRYPLKGMLMLAKAKGMKISTVDVRNSGDTAGPKDRVVGYGSWIIEETPHTPINATKDLLARNGLPFLKLAAHSINYGTAQGKPTAVSAKPGSDVDQPGACFVTLKKNGRLRGCIGSVEAHQSLLKDIADNAFNAAFKDPRFPPVTKEELAELDIHLSILSPLSPMTFTDEQNLLDQLEPGITGLIIGDQGKRAVYLPTVWAQLPDPKAFLSHLKQKAGLPSDHWSDTFKAWTFTTEGIHAPNVANLLK